MKLPMLDQNAQEAAQMPVGQRQAVVWAHGWADSDLQECWQSLFAFCHSIFRNPSPLGWSGGDPTRSSVFSHYLPMCWQGNAEGTFVATNAHSLRQKTGFTLGKSNGLSRNDTKWISSNTSPVAQRSVRLRPVETPSVSRHLLGRGPVRPRPLCWMAAPMQGPSSATQPMLSTARKFRANVTEPNSSGASVRLNNHSRAIGTHAVPVALFVSKACGLPASQEPEGT